VEVLAVQERRTACLPVPDTATLAGEPGALLTTVTVPALLQATLGVKVTLRLAFFPAGKVNGRLKPPTLNPAAVTVAW
jgi:hypothetical protein